MFSGRSRSSSFGRCAGGLWEARASTNINVFLTLMNPSSRKKPISKNMSSGVGCSNSEAVFKPKYKMSLKCQLEVTADNHIKMHQRHLATSYAILWIMSIVHLMSTVHWCWNIKCQVPPFCISLYVPFPKTFDIWENAIPDIGRFVGECLFTHKKTIKKS